MSKILGLDLGTNSIGIAVRNPDNGNRIEDQLEFFRSVIFKSGVGTGKTGEFSYAAERTKYRSSEIDTKLASNACGQPCAYLSKTATAL